MKERASPPFADWEVRAILDGRKTQTRPVVKPQPVSDIEAEPGDLVWHPPELLKVRESRGRNKVAAGFLNGYPYHCPYGQPGDRIWVRETWCPCECSEQCTEHIAYRATDLLPPKSRWRSPMHMPRWASRIDLEIVAVRVEQEQRKWVWVIEFKRIRP